MSTVELVEKPKKTGRITPVDMESIAEMVMWKVTETEACINLGIKPETWRCWKLRGQNTAIFLEALARKKAKVVNELIQCIRDKATKDWRAAERLLSIIDPAAYSDRMQAQAPAVHVQVFGGVDFKAIAAKVYSEPAEPKQLTDASVKPLNDRLEVLHEKTADVQQVAKEKSA